MAGWCVMGDVNEAASAVALDEQKSAQLAESFSVGGIVQKLSSTAIAGSGMLQKQAPALYISQLRTECGIAITTPTASRPRRLTPELPQAPRSHPWP